MGHTNKMGRLKSYSKIAIFFIFFLLFSISFKYNLWKQNRIIIDAPSYYAYLPAFFIHHDLKLNFIDENPIFYKDKIWFYKIENGNKLIKHPIGIAVVLSPFFIIAHTISKFINATSDGYSFLYQNVLTLGVWFYVFIGLFYLRKHLLIYFSEKVTGITLLAIFLGTNLLWYSSFEAFMSHAISFSFLCIANYFFYKWVTEENEKYALRFSFIFALIVLIRPLAISIFIFYIFYAKSQKQNWLKLFVFLKQQFKSLLWCLFVFIALVSLQFMYWKYATGKWIYNPYIDEHFIFSKPQLLPFLIGFRKGLFIYFPILWFSIIGFVYLYKKWKPLFYSTLVLFLFTIYLLSSWWAWSYGICWGIRPMIDYYSFLAFPLAAGISIFESKKVLKYIMYVLVVVFCVLNLFQTWQYKNGLIHYDDMSREAYFKGFLQTKKNAEWNELLRPYNWKRRMAGLPQIEYSARMINAVTESQDVYLKGSNQLYVSCSSQSDFLAACYYDRVIKNEKFRLKFIDKNTVAIKAENGKYLSVKSREHNIIVADAVAINDAEKFLISLVAENDNRVRFQTQDKLYLSIGKQFPFIIRAVVQNPSDMETFRMYLIEDYQGN